MTVKEIKPPVATEAITQHIETLSRHNTAGAMAALATVEFYRDGTATVDWCGDCNHIELLGALRWMEEEVLETIRRNQEAGA